MCSNVTLGPKIWGSVKYFILFYFILCTNVLELADNGGGLEVDLHELRRA
jgi:hypothetical protein